MALHLAGSLFFFLIDEHQILFFFRRYVARENIGKMFRVTPNLISISHAGFEV